MAPPGLFQRNMVPAGVQPYGPWDSMKCPLRFNKMAPHGVAQRNNAMSSPAPTPATSEWCCTESPEKGEVHGRNGLFPLRVHLGDTSVEYEGALSLTPGEHFVECGPPQIHCFSENYEHLPTAHPLIPIIDRKPKSFPTLMLPAPVIRNPKGIALKTEFAKE